ncbi:MAG: signal peptidase II [Planctomycetota bacterium]|nr:signal peptidase II [Planctomycetota bacterium]
MSSDDSTPPNNSGNSDSHGLPFNKLGRDRSQVLRLVWFFVLAGTGLTVDLWSKNAVFDALGYPAGTTEFYLTGWVKFRLFTSINEGALWGMGQGKVWLFASLSVVVILAVLYWIVLKGRSGGWWLTTTLALVSAGTLGNLYDRVGLHDCIHPLRNTIWYGVRDFLDFKFGGPEYSFSYEYPIFNVADMMLVTGAIMLVVHSFMVGAEPQSEAIADGTASAAETPNAASGDSTAMPK